MDILAHGLWSGLAAKAAKKTLRPAIGLNLRWAIFWGVFPDLFAFTLPFVWLFANLIFGRLHFSDFPNPDNSEPLSPQTQPIFALASSLYNLSHSAVIFMIVFGFVWLVSKRPIWELLAWFLHILIDVPTHSYRFYPTPVFWPLSAWKFNGFSWAEPWFLITNYLAIALAFWLLRQKHDPSQKSDQTASTRANDFRRPG